MDDVAMDPIDLNPMALDDVTMNPMDLDPMDLDDVAMDIVAVDARRVAGEENRNLIRSIFCLQICLVLTSLTSQVLAVAVQFAACQFCHSWPV